MSGEKTFPIYKKVHASGNVGYRVDMGVMKGKRVFKSFGTMFEAERFQAKCIETEARKRPVELHDLDEIVRHEVLAAMAKLKEHNSTITQAVDFFLKHAKPASASASIGEVMEDFRKDKQRAKLSEKYITTAWASFFVPFRDHFKNCLIADVTGEQCDDYLHRSKTWSSTTRLAHLRHLNVLFNYALKKGYIGVNPFASVTKPKKPPGTSKLRVVSVENVIKLLRYAFDNDYRPECAALVLVLFCGVRVEEVTRLTWEDVHLDAETPEVVLGEAVTKTGKTRINEIPDNALEWLKLLRQKGNITTANYEGRMRYLKKMAKAGFKQNSARICFASYHVAYHKDAPRTAFLLGHDDPTLLYNTYKALVTSEEAARFWKITPDYSGESVTTQVSQAEIDKARAAGIAKALRVKT